jgi:outer membrane protein assembly factor BamB
MKLQRKQLYQLRKHFALSSKDIKKMPEAKVKRALLKLLHPDRPRLRMEHHQMALMRDDGTIPPNALSEAFTQLEKMRSRETIVRRVAGVPVGRSSLSRMLTALAPTPGLTPDNSGWTALGPGNVGGRLRAIVVDPANNQNIWVGSVGGGIWRTNNGGAKWFPVDDLMGNLAVCSLIMDPTDNNTLYAGTGEGFYNGDAIRGAGIFKTTDGWSWTQLDSTNNPDFYYVNRLAITSDASVILAATETGIFRSTDSGITWSKTLAGKAIGRVIFDPSDNSKAIASGNSGVGQIYYSTDGGLTWNTATRPKPVRGRIDVAYAGRDSSIVYASVDARTSEIWKSTDGGQTFVKKGAGVNFLGTQGWYDNVIWAGDPTDSDFVVVGGIDLYKSTDGGDSLVQISDWRESPRSAHADHHVIVEDPGYNGNTNKIVYFGNDGGLYMTNDVSTVGTDASHTNGWGELNNEFEVTQFYSGVANAATNTIIGGTQDNGTVRFTPATGSNNWNSLMGGDGGAVASDPHDPQTYYGEYVHLNLFRNTNGGSGPGNWWENYICGQFWNNAIRNWDWKPAPYTIDDAKNSTALFIAPFIMDPNNANSLLAGGLSLWRTNDAKTPNTNVSGPSWEVIKNSIGSEISAIAVAAGNSDVIYVGHRNGRIYRSINGTSISPTWTRVDNSGATPIKANRFCTCIAVDPRNEDIVYATFGGYQTGNIWKSTDGGDNWTNIGDTLPEAPARCITIHPQDSDYVYLAMEIGILSSENGGSDWSPTNEGPTNCCVYQLFWLNNTLVCASHGRGMLQIDLTIHETAESVLVGCIDGTIQTLDAQTGTLSDNISLIGQVTAAANIVEQTAYLGVGANVYSLSTETLAQNWTQPVSVGSSVDATPQLDGDTLYITDSAGYLHALKTSDGTSLWKVNVLNLQPQTYKKSFCNYIMNDWVYIATEAGVYALNLIERNVAWSKPIACKCPLFLAANTVFVPGSDGTLYALDARSGIEKWKYADKAAIDAQPVWINGVVFIGDNTGNVTGLNFRTGEPVVSISLVDQDVQGMTADNNILYVIGNAVNGTLYAYEVTQGAAGWDMNEKWSVPIPMGAARPPVIVGSTLFMTALNKKTYAVDTSDNVPGNRITWQHDTDQVALASPAAIFPAV